MPKAPTWYYNKRMIILFGPAGAGKSVQGHLLAARFDWRWLSAGQLLRDSHDPEVMAVMEKGEFVPDESIRRVMGDALRRATDIQHVILDGFPRQAQQAQWLVEAREDLGREIGVVVVLDVSRETIEKRLRIRGRIDDTPDAIDRRLELFREETTPILDYFTQHNIPVAHVDGAGTVGQVHDAIVEELTTRGLI